MSQGSLYIDGRWLEGEGEVLISTDPAHGHRLWDGKVADPVQVTAAVAAARRAFPAWAALPVRDRAERLQAFGDALQAEAEALARLISRETGKPLWESRGEVASMVAKVGLSFRAYHERSGSRDSEVNGVRQTLRHKPHGVLAVLGPYNFPGHLPNGHIVPALLAGNCLVYKPSELTPAVAEWTVQLWQRAAELPPGVLNLVQGGRETGQTLAAEPGIDGLLFTGSAAAGAALHRQLGGQPEKILALEMGGNNPLVVMPEAEPVAAALLVHQSAFLSAGQRCTCARRLLLPEGPSGDAVLEQLLRVTDQARIGAWDDPEPAFMGPLISAAAAAELVAAQAQLQALGAVPLLPLEHMGHGTGFVTPGVLLMDGVPEPPDREYFGPLLQVYSYRGLDEAIGLANATRYGLAAGMLGGSRAEFERFRLQVRAGIVNWNRPLTGASSALPFGGVGISGDHRPSAWYAADYCAYPVASLEAELAMIPAELSPGLNL